MRRSGTLLVLAIMLALPGPLEAQGGFWYSFGLAPGWARVSCVICRADRRVGASGFIRLGGWTGSRARLGAELAGWRERDGGVTQTLTSLSAAVYWYPTARRRLYLKGGAGFVTHRASDGTDVITSRGVGPQMGLGYDLPLGGGRDWLIAPFFNYGLGSVAGGVDFNGGQATDQVTVTFFQLGLSVTRR